MYSIRNLLNAEPAAVAEAVRQILFVLVLADVFVLDTDTLAAISMAVSLVLTLFVRSQVYAPDTVEDILTGPGGIPAGPADGYDD